MPDIFWVPAVVAAADTARPVYLANLFAIEPLKR